MPKPWKEVVTFYVSALASVFQREVSDVMLQGYLIGLEGLSSQEVERAVRVALRSCRFMPSPAELREWAGEAKPEDQAYQAWLVAVRAVEGCGWYRSVRFADPAIAAAIRSLGGWQRFCERCRGEEEKWLRKEFLAAYAVFARSGVPQAEALPLVGEFEKVNRSMGWERLEDRPVLIGVDRPDAEPSRVGRPALPAELRQLVEQVAERSVAVPPAAAMSALRRTT